MDVIDYKVNDGVAELRLSRPARLNAMNLQFFKDLADATALAVQDESVRVIVISAEGNHFSSGLDLKEIPPSSQHLTSSNSIAELQRGFKTLAMASKPTIASIKGYCIGGGLDLASACDFRLASADSLFSLREVRLGIAADLGSLFFLQNVLPAAQVMELALTGNDIDSQKAAAIGLITMLVDTHEALEKATRDLAVTLASNPPLAVQATKRLILEDRFSNLERQLANAAETNLALLASHDASEAVQAILEKRPPRFCGS